MIEGRDVGPITEAFANLSSRLMHLEWIEVTP